MATESVIPFGGLKKLALHYYDSHRPRDLDFETLDSGKQTVRSGWTVLCYNTG